MGTVYGTEYKASLLDFHQRCAACGKLFYFSRNCNGQKVVCPHCKHSH